MKNFVAAITFRFLDQASRPARSAASAIGAIERAQKAAASAGGRWTRGLDQLDRRLNRLASASLVVDGIGRAGQAMIRPFRAAVRTSAEFDQAMTGIGITAQLTDGQLAPLRNTILNTASDLGALPTTVQATFGAVLAEGVYKTEQQLSRAGVAVARFQRLQAVMGEPLSDAEAGAFSSALGGSLKMDAGQLDRGAAMANRSAQQGGVSGASLARALPGQAGGLVGFNFANQKGLADLLTANQIAKRLAGDSATATNNISNLMSAIASPETLRRFDAAGIHLESAIKEGVTRGISPLETVAQITRDATASDQFRIGELFGDKQARDGLMALTQNLDDFRTMSAELMTDGVMKAYLADLDRAAKGPAASFARYTSGVARAGVATGTILAPAAGFAADVLSKVAGWMSRAAESSNPLAKGAVYVVAGLAGMAVAAGAVGHAVIGILGPIFIARTLLGSMGAAGAQGVWARMAVGIGRARLAMIGLNLSMLANPVVLTVAAIVAGIAIVAGAGYLIYRNWGKITAWFSGVWTSVKTAVAAGASAVVGFLMKWTILGPITRNWGRITGFIKGVWTLVGEVVGLGIDLVKLAILRFTPLGLILRNWRPIVSAAQFVWAAVKSGVSAGLALVGDVILKFTPLGFIIRNWTPITTFVSGLWSSVRGFVTTGLTAIGSAISSWAPLQAFKAAFASSFDWLRGLPSQFLTMGTNMVAGMTRGIRGARAEVQAASAEAAGGAATAAQNRLGIRSPSRVFARLGGYTMDGLALGLRQGAHAPLAQVTALSAALIAAMPAGPAITMPADASATTAGGRAGAGAASAGGGGSVGRVSIGKIEQHFHLPAGTTANPRELAREMDRIGAAGLRRALNDAGLS